MKSNQINFAHPFEPVFDKNSRILILGSFPSVKSREEGFYYGNTKNRFWRVIAAVYGARVPTSIPEKKELLLANNLALWDCAGNCSVVGSSDSSIKNVIPNDIGYILSHCPIKAVFTNGKTAEKLYNKYIASNVGIGCTVLASTSPANAAFSFEKLVEIWKAALKSI